MFKLIICLSLNSFAFLDFLAGKAQEAGQAAAYANAASDLVTEVAPSDNIRDAAHDLDRRVDALTSEARTVGNVSSDMKSLQAGPRFSSNRLDENMRATANYVRRLKNLLANIAILGTPGATALNTTETNVALTEVQKNQQAQILQIEDQKIRDLEKENEERRLWANFSENQRKLRSGTN